MRTAVHIVLALACAAIGATCLRSAYSLFSGASGAVAHPVLAAILATSGGACLAASLATLRLLFEEPRLAAGAGQFGRHGVRAQVRRPLRGLAFALVALVGIAAAPDFTTWGFTDPQTAELRANGRLEEPSAYSDQP